MHKGNMQNRYDCQLWQKAVSGDITAIPYITLFFTGFNVETLEHKGLKFLTWDVGFNEKHVSTTGNDIQNEDKKKQWLFETLWKKIKCLTETLAVSLGMV